MFIALFLYADAAENIRIFKDTLDIVRREKIPTPDSSIYEGSTLSEKVARQIKNDPKKNPIITIVEEDTLTAAGDLVEKGEEVAILNFANASVPGGGAVKGSKAQEEDLCRESGIYPALIKVKKRLGTYNLSNRTVYTPGITVFKNRKGKRLKKRFKVDVITSAAINLRKGKKPKNYDNIMQKKTNEILAVPIVKKMDTIVLGAYGAGAFRNDPKDIVKFFNNSIKIYGKKFKKIVFAVIGKKNLDVFRKSINKKPY